MRADAVDRAGGVRAHQRSIGAHLGAVMFLRAVQHGSGRQQPAFDNPPERNARLRAPGFRDFDGFGIESLPDFNPVAPGWITTHGHIGKISLSKDAGSTASNAAQKFGKSVVMGHTHRMGIRPITKGYAGAERQILWGVEVGHLMDQRKAAYLSGATGNWQTGFAILSTESNHTKPELVPTNNGRFIADGFSWEL